MSGSRRTSRFFARHGATLIVIGLMLLFVAWFSAYSIRLHDAHLTHKADLGQMDLAIWNTAHGRLLQEMKGDHISYRMTDHVEPIFLPVSAVFWLWDDVRALLVLQAVALALGAWPVYLLARRKLSECGVQKADWAGVVFAAVYLLMPALQAAAVADFHALSLAAPLIAWALWAVEDRRWIQFTVASVLLMSVQEGMALLAVTLGLYAVVKSLGLGFRKTEAPRRQPRGLVAGGLVAVLGLAWFYVATFVIIPYYAAQEYAIAQTPYAARYGELGDSFGDVLKAMVVRPGTVLGIILQPLRLHYLFGLLVPVAFLALLAPEFLLLSAPLLLANLLSSFAFQYSGELHYSAPLVPFFVVAGAAGLGRWLRRNRSTLATWRLPGKMTRPGPSGTTLALFLALGLVGACRAGLAGRRRLHADRPGVPAADARRLAGRDGSRPAAGPFHGADSAGRSDQRDDRPLPAFEPSRADLSVSDPWGCNLGARGRRRHHRPASG